MDWKSLKKTSGFSLVEIMMSLAAISVLVLATATFFGKRLKEQKLLALNATKARVINQLEMTVTDPNNIRASLEVLSGNNGTNNATFLNCLVPGGVCPADFLVSSRMHPMDFMIPDGLGGYSPMTGFWSNDGIPGCLPPDDQKCPIQSKVYFWFQCEAGQVDPGNGSCRATSHVFLLFQLLPTNAAGAQKIGVNLFHPVAQAKIDKPENFAFGMSVKDLLNLIDKNCLSYHYVDSYDSRGSLLCRCLNNRPQVDGTGKNIVDSFNRPFCQPNACKNDEILLGFEPDAKGNWIPVCLGGALKKHCYTINLQKTPECAENYWITQIDYNQCSITSTAAKKKQASTEDLVCGDDSAQCCREYE